MPTEIKPDGEKITYDSTKIPDKVSDTTAEDETQLEAENSTVKVKDSETFDEPLIVVNNPFKRILKWLYDIRKRQTTKFSINLNIPLLPFVAAVAISIAIVLVFTFGTGLKVGEITITRAYLLLPTPTPFVVKELSATPAPYELSKIGVIKSTYQYKIATETPIPVEPSSMYQSAEDFNPAITSKPLRYLLLLNSGEYMFLSGPEIRFDSYQNERVLITGLYNSLTNILSVSSPDKIEILP
jgi:hypothetical protein